MILLAIFRMTLIFEEVLFNAGRGLVLHVVQMHDPRS